MLEGVIVETWATGINAITLFVDDLEAARDYYQRAFGVPLVFEDDQSAAFNFGNAIINLLQTDAAHELIAPEAVGGPAAGARMQLTIGVDDVAATCALLAERGVELVNGPIDRPWGLRTAAFRDPAGHIWEIAQDL